MVCMPAPHSQSRLYFSHPVHHLCLDDIVTLQSIESNGNNLFATKMTGIFYRAITEFQY